MNYDIQPWREAELEAADAAYVEFREEKMQEEFERDTYGWNCYPSEDDRDADMFHPRRENA